MLHALLCGCMKITDNDKQEENITTAIPLIFNHK
jgi:hypothetical protein